jgi:hypothetical protein
METKTMADSDSGNSATPWLAFLVGIVVVALLVVGFFAFTGTSPQQTADLNPPAIETPDIDLPDTININPPEPAPPAAELPEAPAPEPAPAQ